MHALCRSAGGEPAPVQVAAPWEVVGEVVDLVRARFPAGEIRLHGDMGSRRPYRVDGLALAQAASNGILNALRHAPGSEVRVRLRVGRGRGNLRLEIEDDGKGMDAEGRRRAFEPGWRAGDSAERHPEGKGLGLALVRSLAESAGGSARLARARSGGCRLTLLLPAEPAPAAPPSRARGDVGGLRVAVVDDDATSSAVAVVGLRAEGAAAETVRPGRDLVMRLRRGPWEVALIDRRLGSTSGDRVVRQLRRAGWAGGIVLWTGDRRRPPEGVDVRLLKPSGRREIGEAVAEAAARAADRRTARHSLLPSLLAEAEALASTRGNLRRLGPLAHKVAGALGLADFPRAARRARAVERACVSGRGPGPWRNLIGDLRALAKRTG
jgi:CheY-like chemotaxis protein